MHSLVGFLKFHFELELKKVNISNSITQYVFYIHKFGQIKLVIQHETILLYQFNLDITTLQTLYSIVMLTGFFMYCSPNLLQFTTLWQFYHVPLHRFCCSIIQTIEIFIILLKIAMSHFLIHYLLDRTCITLFRENTVIISKIKYTKVKWT